MLKRLAILVLLSSSIFGRAEKPLPVNGNQQQKRAEPHEDARNPTTPPLNPLSDIDKENAENAERYAYYKAHPEEYLKVAVAPANFSNWVLASLGVVGALVGIVTLFILKRQTDHIVHSERAWVTVNPSDLHPKLYPAWEPGTPLSSPADNTLPVHHQLGITLENAGRTPAQIDKVAARYVRIVSMAELPEEPDYGDSTPHMGIWVVPSERYYGKVNLETNNGILYERDVQDLKLRKSILFIFGIIKYRDVYGNRRETRFGFHYEYPIPGTEGADRSELIPVFRKDGPRKYNYAN